MIENRRLTKKEIDILLFEAPPEESRNLVKFLEDIKTEAFDFFDKHGIEHSGIVVDGRPIYMAVLTKNQNGNVQLWTVANENIPCHFSMFKISLRKIKYWAKKYKRIFATMEKLSKKNMLWTNRLGFKIASENDKTITFVIQGG